ncbi:proline-rich protein 4-like [Lolium rigidum]|uniref:proline-rich protein 4-like n=1 Tax=Lolium rigidum TaxID=89674 RepID=UPI001F5E03E0|nr:proline-rich protein 4-like [Lolium rigidum]
MGARLVPARGAAVLFGALVVLSAVVSFGAAALTPTVVVGSVKCLDCSPNDVNAEDAFKGLLVAVKCRSGAGQTYQTQMFGLLDDNGAFSIPLVPGIQRDDDELGHDCFAQLHSAPDTPCAGLAPPKIGPSSQGAGYLAVADGTVFSPVACLCKKKKKHFMMGPPPPPPQPRPEPSYGPPTPTPTPDPTPSYGPPTPKPPAPPAEDEPEPFFHKHPKMKKLMHKKKPCPPLGEEDKQPKN